MVLGLKKNKGTKHRTKLSPFFWLNELLGEPKKTPSCNSFSCYTKKPDVTATICSRIVLKILRNKTRSQISPKTKVLPGFLVFQVFFAGFPFSRLWLKHPFEKYARQNGFIFPKDRGEHNICLSCHHPVFFHHPEQ